MVIRFFFFQAEDGIRDLYVTGVQTCALPIWCRAGIQIDAAAGRDMRLLREYVVETRRARLMAASHPELDITLAARSEERRVGKEWRCRWSACRYRNRQCICKYGAQRIWRRWR